jgi:hypothetical protein
MLKITNFVQKVYVFIRCDNPNNQRLLTEISNEETVSCVFGIK